MKECVYTISCPITGFVVYVDKTNNPRHRWSCHKNANGSSPVGKWCKAMISIGFMPVFKIAVELDVYVHDEEDILIDHYRGLGMATFNRTITVFGQKTKPYKTFFGKRIYSSAPPNYYRDLFNLSTL